MKIVSENQFSGKTYFYTIASRPVVPRYADDSDGDGQVDEDEPHVSRGFSKKTDLFLKYVEEMYLRGTFDKDEQV